MVEGTCLENKRLFTGSVSSNLTASAMKKYLAVPMRKSKELLIFVLCGIAYSLVPEFTNNVIINHTWLGYFRTLFILVPIFMAFGYLIHLLIKKALKNHFIGNILYFLFFGFFGLAIEWFLIGNSPWANPNAIQFAMFLYWSGLYFMPLIMLNQNPYFNKLKSNLLKFYAVYSLLLLIFSLVASPRVVTYLTPLIWALVYLIINIFYIPYIYKSRA